MRAALRSVRTVLRRFVALTPVLIAVSTLPVALLNLFNTGVVDAVEVLVLGWLLLTPVAAILAWLVLDLSPVDLPWSLGERGIDLPGLTDSDRPADGDGPVETLRERFARGEIDQVEFERRLDALLTSEDIDAERVDSERVEDDRPVDDRAESADAVSERERRHSSERRSPTRRDRDTESA